LARFTLIEGAVPPLTEGVKARVPESCPPLAIGPELRVDVPAVPFRVQLIAAGVP
jgi:hypothetical protein